MNEEAELLRKFVDEGSQEAFAELVRRTASFVYAAALRQTGGDAHLAQDVTQGVYLALACRARRLQHHAVLAGWLHTTTRFLAIKAVRTHARWQRREQHAHLMNASRDPEPLWEELRPVIDEVLHELGGQDRVAILLRYFEGQSLAEVGATMGLKENTARMRVERALEKLRGRLARRGVTSTAAALGSALAAQPSVAAPAGLAVSAAGMSLAGAAVSGGTWMAVGFLPLMSTAKLGLGAASAIAAVALGAFLGVKYQETRAPLAESRSSSSDASTIAMLRAENRRLIAELARAKSSVGTATPKHEAPASSGAVPRASNTLENLRMLMDLRRRKIATPDMDLIRRADGALSRAFVQIFELTRTEQVALQRAIDGARERLATLERENATVARGPNGEGVIAIKPFPEAGGAVYDAMLKTFAETLGTERHNAFLALGADQFERELNWFGTPQRKLTIARAGGTGADVAYTLREEHKLPHEGGNSSSEFGTYEELTRAVGGVAGLLPPDVAARE